MIDIEGLTYLDGRETAALLGVKPETLYAYVSRGRLRSYRRGVGRSRLYLRAQVESLRTLQPATAAAPEGETASAEAAADPAPADLRPPHAESWATDR